MFFKLLQLLPDIISYEFFMLKTWIKANMGSSKHIKYSEHRKAMKEKIHELASKDEES